MARALGYKDPYDAIKRHTKGSVKHRVLTLGGEQEQNFILEGDIYRLIARSKLPTAEKFELWIFDEVLPQIRRTGGYIPVTENDTDLEIVSKALLISQRTVEEQKSKITLLENKVDEIKPKAEYHDAVLNKKDLITTSVIAKDLGLRSAQELHEIMNEAGVLYIGKNGVWMPYANYNWLIKDGYADYHSSDDKRVGLFLKWTEKGRKYIIEHYEDWCKRAIAS